jgi:hypothetical protein
MAARTVVPVYPTRRRTGDRRAAPAIGKSGSVLVSFFVGDRTAIF